MSTWVDTLSFNRQYLAEQINPNLFSLHKLNDSLIKEDALDGKGFLFAADRGFKGAKKYFFTKTLEDMYEHIYSLEPHERNFYEIVVKDNPCKMYLDIELNLKDFQQFDRERLERKIERMIEVSISKIGCGVTGFYVLDSSNAYKISKHVIVQGPVFTNVEHLKNFVHKHLVKCWENAFYPAKNVLDKNVYNNWRCFRLVDNTKIHQKRVLKHGDSIVKSFVLWEKMLINQYNASTNELVQVPDYFGNKKKRKFNQILSDNGTDRFALICQFVSTYVLPHIDEHDKARLDTVHLSPNKTTISIRYQRTAPTKRCFVAKCFSESPQAGSHDSNGFSINIALLPSTIFMHCYGTHAEQHDVRINIEIPKDILHETLQECNPIRPDNVAKLNIVDLLFLHNYELIGAEEDEKDSNYTYFYYSCSTKPLTVWCHPEAKLEIRKSKLNPEERATARCLHYGCGIVQIIKLK
jgi:hypothetical protein